MLLNDALRQLARHLEKKSGKFINNLNKLRGNVYIMFFLYLTWSKNSVKISWGQMLDKS